MIFIRLYFAILKYMNKLFLYICIIGSVKQLQECRRDWLGNSKQQVNILPSRNRDSGAVVSIGVQGVQTRLKRNVRFESK